LPLRCHCEESARLLCAATKQSRDREGKDTPFCHSELARNLITPLTTGVRRQAESERHD
jgi:hypothetical protein